MKIEYFEYDGVVYTIRVGRSAKENTELVEKSNKSDIWFHLSDSASCHVVLETNAMKVPRQVITKCAYICKVYSSAHNSKVIYTKIENVHTTKIPGQVITTNCCTV